MSTLATLDELAQHERGQGKGPGDVLIFLPGEREIRDAYSSGRTSFTSRAMPSLAKSLAG